jgi:hypothetical protein
MRIHRERGLSPLIKVVKIRMLGILVIPQIAVMKMLYRDE